MRQNQGQIRPRRQLGFTNPQWTQSWDISLGVTEMIEEAFFNGGRYHIVERRQLEQVFREQGSVNSGSIDPSTAARIGRILGRSEGLLAFAQIQDLTFGGGKFRNSVLGKALD